MEIRYSLNKDDFINFHSDYVTDTKNYKKLIKGMYLFWILIFVATSYFSILAGMYLIIIGVFISMVILFLLRKKLITNKFKRQFSEVILSYKHSCYLDDTKIILKEDGIHTSIPIGDKMYNWNSIKSINLINPYLFIQTLYHDDLLIPLVAFKTKEDKEQFINTIIKNTNLDLSYIYPKDIIYS